MDNIVIFPRYKANSKDRPPQNIDELRQVIAEERTWMIDEAIDEITPSILSAAHAFGLSIENEFDIGLIVESIRGAMLRSSGLYAPIQDVADSMVVVTNEKGERVHSNGHITST